MEQQVDDLYRRFRKEFLRFVKNRYGLGTEDALDVFQDTVTALVLYARRIGGWSYIEDEKALLFQIGRRTAAMFLRRQKPVQYLEALPEMLDMQQRESNVAQVKSIMKALTDKCRKVLTLFYFKGYALESVATEMQWSNANVAKVNKHRCLQQAVEFLKKRK